MDIEELREAVEVSGPRAPGGRFSAELRSRVVRATHVLWGSGAALVDIGDELGVHVKTVTRYLAEEVEAEEVDEVQDLAPGGGLVPVSIAETAFGETTVRVTTPDGFVVDVLDVADAAGLIRALR